MAEIIVMVILMTVMCAIAYKCGWDGCDTHWHREIKHKMMNHYSDKWSKEEVRQKIIDGLLEDMKIHQ